MAKRALTDVTRASLFAEVGKQAGVLAEQHRTMAEPGSGQKTNG